MLLKAKSLQLELYLWIITSTVVVMLVGSIVAGGVAFFQARELQDKTLTEISLLLKDGTFKPAATTDSLLSQLSQYHTPHQNNDDEENEDETSIILFEIKSGSTNSNEEVFLQKQTDGLQTIELLDEQWRALIVTQAQTKRKFLIAQPIELRDEIAVASAISTLYPLLIFVVGLLLLIHLVLKKQFRLIKQLSKSLDAQDGTHLNPLIENKAPSEIQPFIHSINALIQRVQSTMDRQQRFIADAAHELRTPIAALSLQTENVKNAKNEHEQAERLSSLQQGFLRLGNLVGQLLDLARLQANKDTADNQYNNFEATSLNTIVKQVVQDCYPIAENNNIDLGVIRQDKNLNLNDINGLLSQLIQNAVANAIHYTPENGEVNISLFKENNSAVLLIEDTGPGIPEDEIEKVMQPFYRVMGSGKTGNGLGLSISQEIADKLGGKILLANKSGGGLIYRYEQAIKNLPSA